MNLLVTAGNTWVPIDRVRGITNIFTGRSGAGIALQAHALGHTVTLLTSQPDVVAMLHGDEPDLLERWQVRTYRTFDELHDHMASLVRQGHLDGLIHTAAVSDYRAAGAYAPHATTRFDSKSGRWESSSEALPAVDDVSAGKVSSSSPELWLRLIRTPKLVDLVRSEWCFTGLLVKFKLEVGVTEEALGDIAERSRRHSAADLMVANTLEGASEWALLGPIAGHYQRVAREQMPGRLLEAMARLHEERHHG